MSPIMKGKARVKVRGERWRLNSDIREFMGQFVLKSKPGIHVKPRKQE